MVIRAILLLLVALTPPGAPPGAAETQPAGPLIEEVALAGERFKLEVAADPESRERGLMEREEIAPDGGMLFIYPRAGYRSFWMANCVVDIDLLFIDSRGRIVATHVMTVEPPRAADESRLAYESRLPRYRSRRPAQYVIELEAGSIERLGIEVGDRVELDLRRLRGMAR